MIEFKSKAGFPIFGLIVFVILAQSAAISGQETWARSYGGDSQEWADAICQTSDGGFIFSGMTSSFVPELHSALWVVKLDAKGNLDWQKVYWSEGYDLASISIIIQMGDGGYVVAGGMRIDDYGNSDMWILKLDNSGNLIWQKSYGGEGYESAHSILPTTDRGLIVAGTADPNDVSDYDGWILKLDSSGNIQWQKIYDMWGVFALREIIDGGYVAIGSMNGHITVFKIDSAGEIIWQKNYESAGVDFPRDIRQTPDGGYIVAGETSATDCDDILLFKMNSSGALVWQKAYGVSGSCQYSFSVLATPEGGFTVLGLTDQHLGAGGYDIWILNLDSFGNIIWQKTFGGYGWDEAWSIEQTNDGCYIVAGNMTDYYGSDDINQDAWVIKFDAQGNTGALCPISTVTKVVPAEIQLQAFDSDVSVSDSSVEAKNTFAKIIQSNGTVKVQCPSINIVEMIRKDGPFRFVVKGENLQRGVKVFINGEPWKHKEWRNKNKIVIKGGGKLKEAVPQGIGVNFRIVNPDYSETTYYWNW